MKTQLFHSKRSSKVICIRPLLCQNHSSTIVFGPILMNIFMNANANTKFFNKILYDLKCHFYVMEKFYDFFTLRPWLTFLWTTSVLVLFQIKKSLYIYEAFKMIFFSKYCLSIFHWYFVCELQNEWK